MVTDHHLLSCEYIYTHVCIYISGYIYIHESWICMYIYVHIIIYDYEHMIMYIYIHYYIWLKIWLHMIINSYIWLYICLCVSNHPVFFLSKTNTLVLGGLFWFVWFIPPGGGPPQKKMVYKFYINPNELTASVCVCIYIYLYMHIYIYPPWIHSRLKTTYQSSFVIMFLGIRVFVSNSWFRHGGVDTPEPS